MKKSLFCSGPYPENVRMHWQLHLGIKKNTVWTCHHFFHPAGNDTSCGAEGSFPWINSFSELFFHRRFLPWAIASSSSSHPIHLAQEMLNYSSAILKTMAKGRVGCALINLSCKNPPSCILAYRRTCDLYTRAALITSLYIKQNSTCNLSLPIERPIFVHILSFPL